MNKSIGGNPFSVNSTIPTNNGIFTTKALVDSGAASYIFINTNFAIRIARSAELTLKRLPHPVQSEKFDGSRSHAISHMLLTSISTDSKHFNDVPMVLAPLGRYDIILGRNWRAEQDVWHAVKRRALVWPQ